MYENQKLLSVKEVAAIFNISSKAVYKIFHRKDFPSVKLGNRLYVRENALFEWLKKAERIIV